MLYKAETLSSEILTQFLDCSYTFILIIFQLASPMTVTGPNCIYMSHSLYSHQSKVDHNSFILETNLLYFNKIVQRLLYVFVLEIERIIQL